MKDYFDSPERCASMKSGAEKWEGTPFVLGAKFRTFGADCVHFVAELLVEQGHLSGYSFPAYSLDGGSHLMRSGVKEWLSKNEAFRAIDLKAEALKVGDVLVFLVEEEGVEHHVGIYTDTAGEYLHSAMTGDGVQKRTLRDSTWSRRLRAAWRPVEVAT
jgi:cell wall-associated NlpC family hydrolase